ncbi:MAG: cell division protein CrgA [Actinomycetes bacterium]|jgi:ABC-type multidrug transport system permease subunit
MPESRVRRKNPFTPPPVAQVEFKAGSSSWWAPVMAAMFILGLLWIVVYYIAGVDVPIMKNLGWWNIVVGFAFIGVGFGMSTRWR